jgi:enamine deaminase RidA (YjgF/YER057c/UK114 family)
MDKQSIIPTDLNRYYTDNHFSPGVASGGFVFVSGCTGTRSDGTISENIEDQIRQSFWKLETILAQADLTFAHVVEMTSYHVEIGKQLAQFRRIKDEFIGEPYPAWTAIGISALAVEKALIEIRVIAKVPDR